MSEIFLGSCHCGAVAVEFETALPVASLLCRACACTFCRRHAARTTSDPGGSVRVTVRDQANLSNCRFGLRTADFRICRNCGTYIAALYSEAPQAWVVVNVNVLDRCAEFEQDVKAVDYAEESIDARRARRRKMWTPAVIEGATQG